MDLHERYVRFPTIDLSILELLETTFKDDPFLLLHRLVRHYDTEMIKDNFDVKKLQTLRTILCYEYQLLFGTEKKYTRRSTQDDLCFQKIENSVLLTKKFQASTELTILYDIAILRMILYCNSHCIERHLLNFQQSINVCSLNNNETRVFYMKMMECFLEWLLLRQLLHQDIQPEFLSTLELLYHKDIILWLQIKEEKEWHSFASIFPKLVNAFGPETVLSNIWTFVLNTMEDLKDVFGALTIMIDTCFLLNQNNITKAHYNTCYMEKLWSLIIRGLKSSVQQYRKQALYIMKRITEFMNEVNIADYKLKKHDMIPFICKGLTETNLSINIVKEKFFLVLEALEEKQYHLVAPALTHVSSLVRGNQEHVSCNDCFNITWLQLVLERILQHENNTVVKQGILHVCKLDATMYTESFLESFLNVLNNTFLYECEEYEDEPEFLSNIVTLFVHAQLKNKDFTSRLLKIIDNISWGPIPIFYITKTLRIISSRTLESNSWGNHDLSIIKSIVQKNLNMHSHTLRTASQFELLRTISASVNKINDLTLVASILYEFPPEEALTRGIFSWDIVTTWLKKVLPEIDAIDFVKTMCEEFLHENGKFEMHPKKFALMICMLHDADLIFRDKACPAERALNKWLSFLNGISTRPYANKMSGIDATEFMSHLLHLSSKGANEFVKRLLSSYTESALSFLLANLKSVASKFDYDTVNRYIDIVVSFFNHGELIMPKKEVLRYIEKFQNESIHILEHLTQNELILYTCALHILYFCQDTLYTNCTSFYIKPLLEIQSIKICDTNGRDEVNSKGRIASDCYLILAKLMYQYISTLSKEAWHPKINYLQHTLYLFEMGGKEVTPIIADILKILVDKKAVKDSIDRENLESIFTICWKSTFFNKKNRLFWMSVKNLVRVIININFLALTDATTFIDQFLTQLLEEGDNVPKLKKILLTEMEALDVKNLRNFQEPLLSCLLQGHVLRRDERIENQACLFIVKNYKEYFPHHMSIIDHNTDTTVKVLATTLLHKIIAADSEYASSFLPLVLKKLEKYKHKRYFNHSYIHKIKHRIMQILLILQPCLNKTDTSMLQELMSSALLSESNQHSVRLMQEWILIKIFVENNDLHHRLWNFFEEGIKTRPGCTSSVASIVYHVVQLLPADAQAKFIHTGIKYIARCCLGQQYNMRLYNQVIFVKLYELSNVLNCEHITLEYKGLYDAAVNSLQEGNLTKNSNRIQDDFYLSIFHPINDYTLHTIYFELPRLTDMDADEWISPNLFEIYNFKETLNHPLQLRNADMLLSEVKTSSYITKPVTDQLGVLKNNIETNHDGLSDIQKKIDPLSANQFYNDILQSTRQSMHRKKILSDKEGIVVVASLVDRPPNLGGLARTCEIFSVKELVIANLSHVKDKDFQSLSVSADKWITISEVKPYQLPEYLLEKKHMGWHLVGVEQTANSTNLLNMKFDKKTILVLGNEKDGIPANLIPLFDTCVEIPQTGVIRSLNVHVTGAICIWHYATQHILK